MVNSVDVCMYQTLQSQVAMKEEKFYFSPLTEQLLILTKAVGSVGHAGPLLLLNKSLTCCMLSLLFSIMKSILQNVMETKLENQLLFLLYVVEFHL